VAVLATTASSTAAAVVGAVARATGILPVVVEAPGEHRSMIRAADRALPSDAIAVVVLEPPHDGATTASAGSFLALGYAAGALGAGDVIAVCAPGVGRVPEIDEFATVMMDRGDSWRHQLEAVLGQSGFRPSAVVSPIRRS
jgi:hypothetical protein